MLKVIMAAEKKGLINRKGLVAEFEKTRIAFAGGKLTRHWNVCVLSIKRKVSVLN